jgi:hypothetical protein
LSIPSGIAILLKKKMIGITIPLRKGIAIPRNRSILNKRIAIVME